MFNSDLFEYSISCGEGTLLAYGVTDLSADANLTDENLSNPELTFMLRPCGDECETGK